MPARVVSFDSVVPHFNVCQRISAKGRVRLVPLRPLPVVNEPGKWSIFLVPYLLVRLMDIDTFSPLLTAPSVSLRLYLSRTYIIFPWQKLFYQFSNSNCVDIPSEVHSDQGTQITLQLMADLPKMLGVKPTFITPLHPSANDGVEILHGPLKAS